MDRSSSFRGILCLILFIFISAASCLAASKAVSSIGPRVPQVRGIQTPEHCGFEGNPDIYGIGIRTGYYTQAFSVWFANFFVLREAHVLRAVNTLFMFAMFIGLIFLSHKPSQTFATEAYLLIQITFATWYIGALDVSRYSRRHWQFNFERTTIRNGSFIGMSAYNVWFWWTGLDAMQKTPCGTFAFVFSRVDLYGWYREASMALALVAICFHTLLDCGHLFRILRHFFGRRIRSAEYQERVMCKLQDGLDDVRLSSSLNEVNDVSSFPGGTNQAPSTEETIASKPECEDNQHHEESHACTGAEDVTIPTSPHSHLSITPLPAASLRSDISSLSKRSQALPHAADTAESKIKDGDSLPTLQELYAADSYLSYVLSACPFALTQTNRFQVILWRGAVKFYIPYFRPPHNNDAVTLRTCISTALSAARRHQLNCSALAILFSHLYALQIHPFYRYPWLLHRALTHPSHAQQSWQTLTTITDIRITHQPDKARKWFWIPSAIQSGIISVGLVLSIELTLAWNHISGVNIIGTVGQLIPFILGVGGLVKVLWSRLRMGGDSDGEEAGEDELEPADVRLAEVYYKRKAAYERSVGIEAAGELDNGNNV